MDVQRVNSAPDARVRAQPAREGTTKAGGSGGRAFEVTISDSGVNVGDSIAGVVGARNPSAVGAGREASATRQVTSRPQLQQLLTAEESLALEESFGPLADREVSGSQAGAASKSALYDISGRQAHSPDRTPGRLLDLTG